MKGNPEERAVQLGEYITETGATVRSAAKTFGISKSTVHKDITYRLEKQNHTLYDEVIGKTVLLRIFPCIWLPKQKNCFDKITCNVLDILTQGYYIPFGKAESHSVRRGAEGAARE